MKYYIDTRADADGVHEIHREYCCFLPERGARRLPGVFFLNERVIEEARKFIGDGRFDGCIWCCSDIHRLLMEHGCSARPRKLPNPQGRI